MMKEVMMSQQLKTKHVCPLYTHARVLLLYLDLENFMLHILKLFFSKSVPELHKVYILFFNGQLL